MVNYRLTETMESRIHRKVYVRFGGEYPETRHRNMKMGVGYLAYTYKNGVIAGYKEFFPDGTLRMEIAYRKGVRHGTAKFYYNTGHLLCEGRYKNGRQAGKWRYYRVTGEKRDDFLIYD